MKISKRLFRFGLPLGSATIVAALFDLTIGLYWLLNDLGSSLFLHWWDHSEPIGRKSIINISLVSARVGLAFSLWIFVLLKQRTVLIFWIPLSVIADALFIGHAIYYHPRDFVSDELWIFNIFSFFLFRFYVTAVLYQTLTRLLRNARLRNETVVFTTGNASSASSSSPDLEEGSIPPVSKKYFLVEPIGRGPCSIWRYYDNIPRLGAAVLVAYEIMWTAFVLSTHAMTEFMLGGHLFFLHKEEEIVMRVWRMIMDCIALIFILKKRKALLRFWLILYFWSLFISIGLTIWTVVEWTFETSLVVVIVICFSGLCDIILRFGVLYFCLMLSLHTTLSVSRTQSLKSETRSVRQMQSQRHSIPSAATVLPVANARQNHSLAERAILAGNHF